MAEQVTGIVWEELIGREVFEPLGIACAGFGPPKSTPGKLDQPRGHRRIGPLRFAMTEGADNSSIMGPAGSIHMTLEGLCAYGHEHLQGERGKGKLLNPDTYRRLHTPKLCDYAFGWMIAEETVSKVRVIWHNGSNTMWYAFVAIIPERNSVIAVASNDGNAENAEAAAWNIVRAQIG